MPNEKRMKKLFINNIIIFVGIVAIGIALIVVSSIYVSDSNIFALILIVIMIILIVVGLIYKKRFDNLINTSYIIRIINKPGNPLPIVQLRKTESIKNILETEDFSLHTKSQNYQLFIKVTKDMIRKVYRRYMLEVVVLITIDNQDFYIDEVTNQINKIQDENRRKKIRIDRLIITQIKEIPSLTDKIKESIKEIIFIRTQSQIISTINVGLDRLSQKAVFLYSDDYCPSLYYKHHIEFIKKII